MESDGKRGDGVTIGIGFCGASASTRWPDGASGSAPKSSVVVRTRRDRVSALESIRSAIGPANPAQLGPGVERAFDFGPRAPI